MDLIRYLKCRALRWSLPLPFDSRNHTYSTVSFVEEDAVRPTKRLLDVSLKGIEEASKIDLTWVSKRMKEGPYVANIWPGEHYRLLAGLVVAYKPKRILEVGTYSGLSALAMKGSMPESSELITMDIVPWNEIKDTALKQSDFEDGRLRQVIGDLSEPAFFASFASTLSGCDFLFVDGPKDGVFEKILLGHLSKASLPQNALVVFDDTRLWNMLKIWHDISRPKIDLTSFGHYTGIGMVDWNG